MEGLAYILGGTLGAALDPLLWIIAAMGAFAFKQIAWPIRLAVSIVLSFVVGAVIVNARAPSFGPTSSSIFIFSAIAVAIWFGIFMGIRALIAKRRAAP